jgi:hypothetical protein
MNVELKGTLKLISAEEKINDGLSKKELVVTIDEDTQYPQDIICQALNKSIELITADFKMGDRVSVNCNLRGKASNGKYYNQLILWSIKKS